MKMALYNDQPVTFTWRWQIADWGVEAAKPAEHPAAKVSKTLRAGDIVKVTRTFKVTGLQGADGFYGRDVQEPNRNPHWVSADGSAQYEVVKKAKARQRQSFKVGDVIDADTLREVQWVRGTVIERDDNEHAAFVLRADGRWHDLIGGHQLVAGWPFEAFSGNYRLARLPK